MQGVFRSLVPVARGIDTLSHWVGVVAYWLVPITVLVGVWNVFGRFFGQAIQTNITSNAFLESQWYLFSIVIFLGAPYALLYNEHVRVDVMYTNLSNRNKAWVNVIGSLFFLIPFCLFIIYFSWNFVATSWAGLEQSPDPSGLPRYPIKSLLILGPALLMLQGISEIIKNAAFLTGALPTPTLREDHRAAREMPELAAGVAGSTAPAAPAGAPATPDSTSSDAPATASAAPDNAPTEPPHTAPSQEEKQ